MSNKIKIREAARKLNPMDDLMFRKMAKSQEFCEEILRVLRSDKKLKVIHSSAQFAVTNLQGRSVILDAYCQLGDGTYMNIEIRLPQSHWL